MIALGQLRCSLSTILCAMSTFAVLNATSLAAPQAPKPEELSTTYTVSVPGTLTTLSITPFGVLNARNLRSLLRDAEVEVSIKPDLHEPFGRLYTCETGSSQDAVNLLVWRTNGKNPSWEILLNVVDGLKTWVVEENHPMAMTMIISDKGVQVAAGLVNKAGEKTAVD